MGMIIGKYSFGVGDRFAHQAKAQLRAFQMLSEAGVEISPVWNKSHREHTTIGSEPSTVRAAADAAVKELGWAMPYYVDADHIRLITVDGFVASSDFYTLDVADFIGQPCDSAKVTTFIRNHPELVGQIVVPGINKPIETTLETVEKVATKYFTAIAEAGKIYRHIVELKGEGNFITEVSMDETDSPQTPPELLVILALIAAEGIPAQTIAPKFTGRFNKGVDYVGDLAQFEKEFRDDIAVIAYAVNSYGLPASLKLSVHSGSDKFSIYAPIRRALADSGAGIHLKTAGTTWLEELIGLAEAGGEGLTLAKDIYSKALAKREALCEPYAAVIDVDPAKLPSGDDVARWSSEQYVSAVRHDPANLAFNPSVRQLLHVGYKIAAQMGDRYLDMLGECQDSISRNVTENLYARHMKPLFLDE